MHYETTNFGDFFTMWRWEHEIMRRPHLLSCRSWPYPPTLSLTTHLPSELVADSSSWSQHLPPLTVPGCEWQWWKLRGSQWRASLLGGSRLLWGAEAGEDHTKFFYGSIWFLLMPLLPGNADWILGDHMCLFTCVWCWCRYLFMMMMT